MRTEERAAAIRKELKANGYSNRMVSVRTIYCGYSSVIKIKIKNYSISESSIEKIAESYERVCWNGDGEIMQGGNCYVHIYKEFA